MSLRQMFTGAGILLAGYSPLMAADAIVAAEPEPAEYVRVCDAYGTTYFYIPGT
ncbi:porin, partial [Rhizobium sp. Root1203]|uniref:porin n=1 Tax=Rhizobium sp. Root1203 TaxID=1736427 RepID=UPI000A42816F